jgi:hypothetical protein
MRAVPWKRWDAAIVPATVARPMSLRRVTDTWG